MRCVQCGHLQALGRTVTGYTTRCEGESSQETVENRESLHSLLVECLAGLHGTLLASFGLSFVTGSAAQGKLMGARSCYPPVAQLPYHARRQKGAASIRKRLEAAAAAALVEEECHRSATCHLLLLLGAPECTLQSATPAAAAALLAGVTHNEVAQHVSQSGIRRLRPYYAASWDRTQPRHSNSAHPPHLHTTPHTPRTPGCVLQQA